MLDVGAFITLTDAPINTSAQKRPDGCIYSEGLCRTGRLPHADRCSNTYARKTGTKGAAGASSGDQDDLELGAYTGRTLVDARIGTSPPSASGGCWVLAWTRT